MPSEYKTLTKEYNVRNGQWVTKAKVLRFDDKKNEKQISLCISKFQSFGKKLVFRGCIYINEKSWQEILSGKGIVAKAVNEYKAKAGGA